CLVDRTTCQTLAEAQRQGGATLVAAQQRIRAPCAPRRTAMSLRNCLNKVLLAGYYGATLPYRRWTNSRHFALGAAPILVLFYHRIADDRSKLGTHSNRMFRQQIRWLQKHCELISLEESQRRIRGGFNQRLAASITFDDG